MPFLNASRALATVFFVMAVVSFPLLGQSYNPNTSYRNEIRKASWNALKPETPKKYRLLTSMVFNTNQCFDLYEKAAKAYEWPIYEPVTILTFKKVIMDEVVRGSDYSKAEIETAYQNTERAYGKGSKDENLSDKELQKKYDPIILEALWIATLNEFSKGKDNEVISLARQRMPNKTGNDVAAETGPKTTSSKEQNRKKSEIASSAKIPGVSDIILRTVTNYGLNGVYVDNEVSILFDNGEILTNPSQPLDELNIAQSKKKHPKRWNLWKKKGDVLYVTKPWKNKTYDWKKWFKLRPGKKDFKISGRYNTSDAFGGATVINASTVSFDAQGRFAWKTVKGGDTSWKPIYSKSSSAGTYEIDGYKVTLNYNNGTKEAFFFGLYPKDNEHFVIGVSHFVPVKK
ncbi:hypothetical protein [Allomuricauda sp. d1]|uniref:hypothetical protein n=1 Tax=Allomuricauda sp. d1 TaxID=3136725 RepID=UPI0031CF3809